jgi:NADH:ubiquinone oxidoreductase subunit D
LLTGNRIFKQRNVDVGVVKLAGAWAWGFSGAMVRGSSAAWNLRTVQPYECYPEFDLAHCGVWSGVKADPPCASAIAKHNKSSNVVSLRRPPP